MPTKPVQGGNTGTWGTDLNAFLDVALNADGTLKSGGGGGSGAPLQADYLFTTDGTTITRYNRTGAVSDTGTDIGDLVNDIAANYICCAFAGGVFPWTTKMTLDTFIGMSLIGVGGQQDERKAAVGGRGATQFKWTPASGQAFSSQGVQGLYINGIAFQYTNASYASGDGTEDAVAFCTIEGVDHTTPTRHVVIENCYFGATGSGKLDSSGPLLDVNKTVNIAVRSTLFCGGLMNIRSHHTISADDFANVVEFTACRFSRHKAPTVSVSGWPSFYGSGISWAFRNCHWEPSQAGPLFTHKTVVEGFQGLTFEDCWWGDQSSNPPAAGAMIEFFGAGLRIVGGHMDLQDGYSIVKTIGSTAGVEISGMHIDNINDSASGFINCTSNGIADLRVQSLNTYPTTMVNGNLSQPPSTGQVPYFSKTADYTLQQSDHNRILGVDSTAAAVTITLPAAGCVGCTFTIKKIDASANSVTVQRASSATIDGATTYALAAQYKFVRLVSTGSNWMVVGSN